MTKRSVGIVNTGVANRASVVAALRRVGAVPVLLDGADAIRGCDRILLPGVGAFGAGMAELRRDGSDAALVERYAAGTPLLAICLGLQLLAASSDESPGVAGLGVIGRTVRQFDRGLRQPQLGWNQITGAPGGLVEDGEGYFANSYVIDNGDDEWKASWSDHGGPFVAALQRGDQLACQFHPELSGAWGEALLARWCQC